MEVVSCMSWKLGWETGGSSIWVPNEQPLETNWDHVKGTRGGKSSEPEVVAVIPIYCETC